MTCIKNLLESLCSEVETEVKKHIDGFFGFAIKNNLPQDWVFITEQEEVTFSVDRRGKASVKKGRKSPDVTISLNHDDLAQILRTRKKLPYYPPDLSINFYTNKGKTAFTFLRNRFGL